MRNMLIEGPYWVVRRTASVRLLPLPHISRRAECRLSTPDGGCYRTVVRPSESMLRFGLGEKKTLVKIGRTDRRSMLIRQFQLPVRRTTRLHVWKPCIHRQFMLVQRGLYFRSNSKSADLEILTANSLYKKNFPWHFYKIYDNTSSTTRLDFWRESLHLSQNELRMRRRRVNVSNCVLDNTQ